MISFTMPSRMFISGINTLFLSFLTKPQALHRIHTHRYKSPVSCEAVALMTSNFGRTVVP